MRLGIVSDIHCNIDALKLALERMGRVDELLCAGDAFYEYRFSNEVIELLRSFAAMIDQQATFGAARRSYDTASIASGMKPPGSTPADHDTPPSVVR